MRAIRPALQFLLLGTLLFALDLWRTHDGRVDRPSPRRPIVLSAADLVRIRGDFERDSGRAPDAGEESALIAAAVDEEILYREARHLGLDRGDRSIRWRLIQKAAFLEGLATVARADEERLLARAHRLGLDRDDAVVRRILVQKMHLLLERGDPEPPDDATLRAFFDAHAADYRQPARVSIRHVFLDARRRGADAEVEARALRGRLERDGVPAAQAIGLGDAFTLRHEYSAATEQSLAKVFGPTFAAAVMHAPVGRWSGPIASPYGVHLVWIETRDPETIAAFPSVRGQVEQRFLAERRQARFRGGLEELRRAYPVRIERNTAAATADIPTTAR